MTRYFTNFEEGDIGDNPPDGFTRRWHGPASPSQMAYTVAHNTPVFKRRELQVLFTVGNYAPLSYDAPGDVADTEQVTAFTYKAVATDGDPALIARGAGTIGSERAYFFRCSLLGNQAIIGKYVGSPAAPSTLASAVFTFVVGESYLLRAYCKGTDLKLRVWNADDKEPSTWNVTTSDADLSTGWVALWPICGFGSPNANLQMNYNFHSVGTGTDTAWRPRTNAEFEAYFRDGGGRRFLFELSAVGYDISPTDFDYTNTFNVYAADGGFISKAWDTPPTQTYAPTVLKTPTFRQEMPMTFTGTVPVGFGQLVMSNPRTVDGAHGVRDNYTRMKWNKDHVHAYLGGFEADGSDWAKHDFRHILFGRLGQPTAPSAQDEIIFPVFDLSEVFTAPIQTSLIAASGSAFNNTYEPIVLGVAEWVDPPRIDEANLRYQAHDGAVHDNGVFGPFVYDNWVPLFTQGLVVSAVNTGTEVITSSTPHGGLIGSSMHFDTGTPPAPLAAGVEYFVVGTGSPPSISNTTFALALTLGGAPINLTGSTTGATFMMRNYRWDLTAGTFELVTTPAGRVTLPQLGAASLVQNLPDVLSEVVFTRLGLSLNHKDTTSFAALESVLSSAVGDWVDWTRHTVQEILSRLLVGTNTWLAWTFDALLQVGRIGLPAATGVKALYERDIKEGSMRLERVLLPVDFSGVDVSYAPKHYTQGPPQIGDPQFIISKYFVSRATYTTDAPPIDEVGLGDTAPHEPFDTIFSSGSVTAVEEERDRLKLLYGKKLGVFTFQTRLHALFTRTGSLAIGDTLEINYPRFDWKQWTALDPSSPDNQNAIDSRMAVVIGMELTPASEDGFFVKLTVFRQLPGYFPDGTQPGIYYLLLENGSYALQETGSRLFQEA